MTQNVNKIKLLIVDDSDVILHSLKKYFEEFNCEVFTCVDGLEGIRLTAEKKPHLIILDLMMPNFDGIKMLQVKSILKEIVDIPVVVISANTVKSNVVTAIEAGASKVISKPIDKDILVKTINDLLEDNLVLSQSDKRVNSDDDKDIKTHLTEFFMESFPNKRIMLNEALTSKNIDLLKMVIHEIKGAGGTMGHQEVTDISQEIEKFDLKTEADWMFVQFKINQLYKIINKIEQQIVIKR